MPNTTIKTGYDISGNRHEYIVLTYSKGLEYFSAKGFYLCPNNQFMESQTEYAHFVKGKGWETQAK